MKLYNGLGPNPQVVRMFIAEKGIDIDIQDLDLMKGENRQQPHLSRNPTGGLPTLEMDNGEHLAEITAICEYLEDKFPEPALIGTTAEEKAITRMWTRRIDLGICEPMTTAFRGSEGLQLFQDRMRCLPEAADGLKAVAQDKIRWLDSQLQGRPFVCGDRFTLADIFLYCFLGFGASVGQPVPDDCANIQALLKRIGARASASA